MSVEYVFVSNNLYNSSSVKPVKWWNRLIGFPGETVMGRCKLNMNKHSKEALAIAKDEFAQHGMYPELMGERH